MSEELEESSESEDEPEDEESDPSPDEDELDEEEPEDPDLDVEPDAEDLDRVKGDLGERATAGLDGLFIISPGLFLCLVEDDDGAKAFVL